mmetsp:Transcript_9868/g.29564  ORF Transcript_9868/g.29564 Transcript_9868/m.29564 type:complete len:272 (+) Transcript_9868:322-1137(+)
MQPCAGSDALKPAAGGPRPAPLQRSRAVKGAAAAKPTRAVSSRRLKRPHTSEPSGRRSRQHSPPPAQLCSSGTAVRSPAARWTARKPPCVSSANPEGVRRVRSLPVTSGPPIKAQRDAADLRSSSLTPSSAPLPTSSESRSGRPRGRVRDASKGQRDGGGCVAPKSADRATHRTRDRCRPPRTSSGAKAAPARTGAARRATARGRRSSTRRRPKCASCWQRAQTRRRRRGRWTKRERPRLFGRSPRARGRAPRRTARCRRATRSPARRRRA